MVFSLEFIDRSSSNKYKVYWIKRRSLFCMFLYRIFFSSTISLCVLFSALMNTARAQDTKSQGYRTAQKIHPTHNKTKFLKKTRSSRRKNSINKRNRRVLFRKKTPRIPASRKTFREDQMNNQKHKRKNIGAYGSGFVLNVGVDFSRSNTNGVIKDNMDPNEHVKITRENSFGSDFNLMYGLESGILFGATYSLSSWKLSQKQSTLSINDTISKENINLYGPTIGFYYKGNLRKPSGFTGLFALFTFFMGDKAKTSTNGLSQTLSLDTGYQAILGWAVPVFSNQNMSFALGPQVSFVSIKLNHNDTEKGISTKIKTTTLAPNISLWLFF